jgi:hypothetical protein
VLAGHPPSPPPLFDAGDVRGSATCGRVKCRGKQTTGMGVRTLASPNFIR